MKGWRTSINIKGYTLGEAEMQFTPNGKAVTAFPVAIGGNRERNIKGTIFRCLAWEDNAQIVLDNVMSGGLAVDVTGRLKQSYRQANGHVYINNKIDIDKLVVQTSRESEVMVEVPIVRTGLVKERSEQDGKEGAGREEGESSEGGGEGEEKESGEEEGEGYKKAKK